MLQTGDTYAITNLAIGARRRAVAASLLAALIFGPALAASGDAPDVVELQRPTGVHEDDRDPIVFSRNVVSLAERAMTIGQELGIATETIELIDERRREFEYATTYELSEAAEQLGPYIGRVNRALSRLVIMPAPPEDQRSPATSPDGAWTADDGVVADAAYPTQLSLAVSETVVQQGNTNTSVKVCASNQVLGCLEDADCPGGDSCIDRPTEVNETHVVVVQSGCSSRPSDLVLKQLYELAVEIESVQVVTNRICNQTILGFNGSVACIATDLILLEQRTLLEFKNTCSDRWAAAEVRSSHSRLAYLRAEDELIKAKQSEIANSAVANHDATTAQVEGVRAGLSDKLDDAIALVDGNGAAFDLQIAGARDSINANIDGTRSQLTGAINSARDVIDTNVDETRSQLAGAINGARDAINTNVDGTRDQVVDGIDGARDSINANVDDTRNALSTEIGAARDSVNANIDGTRGQLASNIDASRAQLSSEIDASRAQLSGELGAVRDQLDTNIDGTRDQLATNIDDTRATLLAELKAQDDLFFRAEIERVLLYGERLAVYYLPEAQGGQLERIHQIVEDAIDAVDASGEPSYQARARLNSAVVEMNAGRFKRAFNYFSSAYFEATRLPGERQP